jgi:P27 family predicted phage terminase small subunit
MPQPRKPSALKIIEGTARADRMNPAEPKPSISLLDAPEHLSAQALETWAQVAPILAQMRVLSIADPIALERLCEVYAETRRLRAVIEAEGYTYETASVTGERMLRANPAVAMLADADRRLLAWLRSFGMTPADRGRVSAAPEEGDTTPWAAYA